MVLIRQFLSKATAMTPYVVYRTETGAWRRMANPLYVPAKSLAYQYTNGERRTAYDGGHSCYGGTNLAYDASRERGEQRVWRSYDGGGCDSLYGSLPVSGWGSSS